jgi:nitrogen fixation-related uncharacterized protein
MINVASAIIMMIFLLFTWAILKSGSDYDDQWEDYEDVH